KGICLALDGTKEAGFKAFVARGPNLFDLDQERIAVAIEGDVLDRLSVAAGLAFHPKLLTRAAPKMGLARGNRRFDRGPVHPSHHQHPASGLFLDDGGDQAIGGIFQILVKTHDVTIAAYERFLKAGMLARKPQATPTAKPTP